MILSDSTGCKIHTASLVSVASMRRRALIEPHKGEPDKFVNARFGRKSALGHNRVASSVRVNEATAVTLPRLGVLGGSWSNGESRLKSF